MAWIISGNNGDTAVSSNLDAQLTVVAHCHVGDDLLERGRLLALERLVAPVARVPEFIAEVLDLPTGWDVSYCPRASNSLKSFASAMVGRVSDPLWAVVDRWWEDECWNVKSRWRCALRYRGRGRG